MQRQDLWPTPLWYFEVPPTLINPNDIAQEAYAHQKMDAGVVISNAGGYQSSALTMNDRVHPTLTRLMEYITQQSRTCFQELGFEHQMSIANYWININRQNNYNKMHIHSMSILSGCYYAVTPPKCGNIIFFNRPETSYIMAQIKHFGARENSFTAVEQAFEPRSGGVLIFPGWLQHSVEENLSGEDRISVAFNFA